MGKSKAKAPNISGLIDAANNANATMSQIGNRQQAFAEQQYYEMRDLFKDKILPSQLAAQEEQLRQARDYYDYQQETYRPLEKRIVDDAMNYDSSAMQDRLMTDAAVQYGKAATVEDQISDRQMMARGVNPNSGAARGMRNTNSLLRAAGRASAMTDAARQADAIGDAKRYAAAGLGRGLAGYSTAAYAGALGAGNSAMSNQMRPAQFMQSGLAAGASTIGNGLGMQLNGLGNALNTQASIYGNQLRNNSDIFSGFMSLAGGMMGTGGLKGLKGLFD